MNHNTLFLKFNTNKFKVIFIYMLTLIFYFIYYLLNCWKNIHYIPITLYTTTNYGKFIEQVLILNKVNYVKLYHPYTNYPCYFTNKNKEICINPPLDHFINDCIDIQPLDDKELDLLKNHFNLNYLDNTQEQLLNLLPTINAYQISKENYIETDIYQYQFSKIKSINKVNNDLYCIQTNKNCIYTSILLTDKVKDLICGDVLNITYYNTEEDKIDSDNKYIYTDQYKLVSLRKGLNKNCEIFPFYSLDQPRTEIILHPFHLPKSTDFILSIMILTQYIINNY